MSKNQLAVRLNEILNLRLAFFVKESGLEQHLQSPHSVNDIAEKMGWEILATERFLKALTATGLANQTVTEQRVVYVQRTVLSDSDLLTSDFKVFLNYEMRPGSIAEVWMKSGEGLELEQAFIEFGVSSEQDAALLKYYLLIVNQYLRSDVIEAGLKSGKCQARKALGITTEQIFDHYLSHPHVLQAYSSGFSAINWNGNKDAADRLPKIPGGKFLDVAGGAGDFAAHVALAHPEFHSIGVYDLPEIAKTLRESRQVQELRARRAITWKHGSFFKQSSLGLGLEGLEAHETFDVISLGWILHDWNDKDCVGILKKVKHHLSPRGRLFILENIKKDRLEGRMYVVDFIMLLMADGFERDLHQYQQLFASAGLQFSNLHTTVGRDLLEVSL